MEKKNTTFKQWKLRTLKTRDASTFFFPVNKSGYYLRIPSTSALLFPKFKNRKQKHYY